MFVQVSNLLLVTHIWLWYAEGIPDTLSPGVVARIYEARRERRLYVSMISVWEISLLLAKNRIVFSIPLSEWVEQGSVLPGPRLRALTTKAAIESILPPGNPHANPADRFLIAEVRVAGLTLVITDGKIIDYGRAEHVRLPGA